MVNRAKQQQREARRERKAADRRRKENELKRLRGLAAKEAAAVGVEAEAAAPAAVSTSGLPSAASLLDGGGTASWLDKPAWAAAPREPDPVPARPSVPRRRRFADPCARRRSIALR